METNRIRQIVEQLPELTAYQLGVIERIISQLKAEKHFWRNPNSEVITDKVLGSFGDVLRIHHVFSAEALSKDRFEYALEQALRESGISAQRAPRGNPGHDITIEGVPWSLKTQANKDIELNKIHISKFMELGKGEWTDKVDDLWGLLERFYQHLSRYERIFTLRRLRDKTNESYELVEIPKSLLGKARSGSMSIKTESRQNPKPGYCTVLDQFGAVAFKLYFDGGTERKLQVKDLRKELCVVHATWRFPRQTI